MGNALWRMRLRRRRYDFVDEWWSFAEARKIEWRRAPWTQADIASARSRLRAVGNAADLAAMERRPVDSARAALRAEWLVERADPRARYAVDGTQLCHRAVERGLYRQLLLERADAQQKQQRFGDDEWRAFFAKRAAERRASLAGAVDARNGKPVAVSVAAAAVVEPTPPPVRALGPADCADEQRAAWLREADALGAWLASRGRPLAIPATRLPIPVCC